MKAVLIDLTLFILYWAPSIIAALRKVHGIGQVIVVNLFLGWTVIGWIIALVMAFRHVPKTYGVVHGQPHEVK